MEMRSSGYFWKSRIVKTALILSGITVLMSAGCTSLSQQKASAVSAGGVQKEILLENQQYPFLTITQETFVIVSLTKVQFVKSEDDIAPEFILRVEMTAPKYVFPPAYCQISISAPGIQLLPVEQRSCRQYFKTGGFAPCVVIEQQEILSILFNGYSNSRTDKYIVDLPVFKIVDSDDPILITAAVRNLPLWNNSIEIDSNAFEPQNTAGIFYGQAEFRMKEVLDE